MIWVMLALLAASSARAEDGDALPSRAILLFVAGWCAPCHAEVARLPEIVAAARPYRVLVVSLDDERRAERMLRDVAPANRWRPASATMAQVRRDLLTDVAGLPYSVAIDARGRLCGDSHRGLTAPRARALLDGCAAGLSTTP